MTTLFVRGHDDLQTARESLDVHWQPYARHDGAAALARQVRSLDVNDTLAVADDLGDLDVPARLVWGAADRFQKLRYGRRFAHDLDAELVRIEGGKHFVLRTTPTRWLWPSARSARFVSRRGTDQQRRTLPRQTADPS